MRDLTKYLTDIRASEEDTVFSITDEGPRESNELVGRRMTLEEPGVKRDYKNVKQIVINHYRELRSKQTHELVL